MTPTDRFNAAVELRQQNHLDDCQESVDRLWREGFQNEYIALLRGNLSIDHGDFENALKWHTLSWMMIAPNNVVKPECADRFQSIALAVAYSRMRLGLWDDYTWQLWEIGRMNKSWHPAPNTRPWAGQGDKMIVMSEGGFGDGFLFTRFFQKLDPIQRGASRYVMGPQFAGLKGFLDTWDGMATVYHDQLFDWKEFKYSTALMSLMAVQGIRTPADIPKSEPWWPTSSTGIPEWDNTDHFHRPPSMAISRGTRLGLCWNAEELGVQKRTRSIDNHKDLEPLRPWSFVNLCPGQEIEYRLGPKVIDVNLKTWTDTARVIAGLDCVVTVNTAVAHLAGLLNVPTLVIVPLGSDWKWGTAGESNWWWPSVRVIRNTSPYTWRPALERVAAILEKL